MSVKQLVIHVLVVWPPGHDPKASEELVEPKRVFTFIEPDSSGSDASQACQRMAVGQEAFGHLTELVTVSVDADRADPADHAIEQVLREVRTAPTHGARQILRPDQAAALTVSVEDAATYLSVVHGIGAPPNGTDLDIVLLRLARRAEAGDKAAVFALAEFAAEVRLAEDPTGPVDVDPLTFATTTTSTGGPT